MVLDADDGACVSSFQLSRLSFPVSLDQKEGLLFSSSKGELPVCGTCDLGVHFALWTYQVSEPFTFQVAKSQLKPSSAWREGDRFDLLP